MHCTDKPQSLVGEIVDVWQDGRLYRRAVVDTRCWTGAVYGLLLRPRASGNYRYTIRSSLLRRSTSGVRLRQSDFLGRDHPPWSHSAVHSRSRTIRGLLNNAVGPDLLNPRSSAASRAAGPDSIIPENLPHVTMLIPVALERRQGILVIQRDYGKYTVRVDQEVPCGMIHESRQ